MNPFELKPMDIVLVRAGEIHRPVIHDTSVYERMIAYLSPSFFEEYRQSGTDLFQCFSRSQLQQSGLIRLSGAAADHALAHCCRELTDGFGKTAFGTELYRKVKFMEFLILLNRYILEDSFQYASPMTSNPTVLNIMEYINAHLTEEALSIDSIAKAVFLNRSYLMHLFKEETGYTIGKYISEKRMFLARKCILEGMSVTEACYRSGFKNYTSFYYAYKNKYGCAPTKK